METENKNVFTVKSKMKEEYCYTVDMTVGVCTCPQGIDGSPCSHQAAVAIHYDKASINCIPTLAPAIRLIYAQIAMGEKAEKNPAFYASLHDKTLVNGSYTYAWTSTSFVFINLCSVCPLFVV